MKQVKKKIACFRPLTRKKNGMRNNEASKKLDYPEASFTLQAGLLVLCLSFISRSFLLRPGLWRKGQGTLDKDFSIFCHNSRSQESMKD